MSSGLGVVALIALYKVCVLLSGVAFAFMGYRLFLADRTGAAGSFRGEGAGYKLNLEGGAPGVFFSLFGAALIIVSLVKGFKHEENSRPRASAAVKLVIPSEPPEDAK